MENTDRYFQELRNFFEIVKEMRETQKSYFKNRSGYDLEKSKRLEKTVDSELKRLEGIVGGQLPLF